MLAEIYYIDGDCTYLPSIIHPQRLIIYMHLVTPGGQLAARPGASTRRRVQQLQPQVSVLLVQVQQADLEAMHLEGTLQMT